MHETKGLGSEIMRQMFGANVKGMFCKSTQLSVLGNQRMKSNFEAFDVDLMQEDRLYYHNIDFETFYYI
jgi:hypothetical protein